MDQAMDAAMPPLASTPPRPALAPQPRWARTWLWAPAAIYAGLLALHAPLLRLPYFWDEAGYFIFAALDVFRRGWLVPHSTLANGHPPLLSLYLAGAWTLGGFHPWVTRAAMLVWQAALVWGVYRLAQTRLPRAAAHSPVAHSPWIPALLIALAPLSFAQATLAQLDLPVAALIVWALVWRGRGRWALTVVLLCAACLMKETAVIAAVALVSVDVWRHRRAALLWVIPAAVVAAWFLYYRHVTGYWFGNPQYFAYNVGEAARSVPRIGLSLLRRLWQFAGYDGMWLLTGLALWSLWRQRRRAPMLPPAEWTAVVAAYLIFHSIIGGAVLARYLLPALALYFVWIGEQLAELPRAAWLAAGCAAFLVLGWFWNPPYPFPYEDNLAYVQFVELQQAAAHQLASMPLAGPVWTAWPATDELSRPELGYVTHPVPVRAVPDFSAQSLAAVPGQPAELFIYSREYQPQLDLAAWLPFWQRWGDRYFRHSPPASETAWLQHLGLKASFSARGGGQWLAIAVPRH
jgi:hypothetical protein